MSSTTVDRVWFETLMERKGLSLRAVARRMAIDPSALSRALNAKRKLKAEEIRQLADILEQPPATVLAHIDVPAGAVSLHPPEGFQEAPQDAASGSSPRKRHPLFGSMKGTTIIMPGVDLTQPAEPDWARVYDDDYDHGVVVGQQGGKSS